MEYLPDGCGGTLITSPPVVKEVKPFELPPPNNTMRRVFAYLTRTRGIDAAVMQTFADRRMIYESEKYHNAVFVGYDTDGTARHAHKRGTGQTSAYKGNVDSSLPEYSFHRSGSDRHLYLFKAPIDMLSFISMHQRGWKNHSYSVVTFPVWDRFAPVRGLPPGQEPEQGSDRTLP